MSAVRPFPLAHVAFLFICLPGLSLLVSALFRWPCRNSIRLSPRSVAAVVSALFRWPCSTSIHRPCSISMRLSPRSLAAGVRPFPLAGHAAFLFICLPGLSLLVSALFRWPCSISIHLSPRSVTVTFLFICLPGLSLVVSALFRWPCSKPIHSSPRCATGVRPFPLAMWHFYLFVSQVCHCWCPPFSVNYGAFLFICLPSLSMKRFYSFVSQVCRWWCPPFIAGHVEFLFICLPGLSLLVPCSISIHLSPRSVTAGVRLCRLAM